MVSIGEMLRAAREAQGRTVAEVATELCLTERYLQALEENDIQVLPGIFFYQSFVRQYAALVGLDAKQINNALARMPGAPVPADAAAPIDAATQETPLQIFDLGQLRDLTPSHTGSRPATRPLPSRAANPSPGAALLERIAESKHRMSIAGYPAGISTAALVGALVLGAGIFAWWNHTPQGGPVTAAASAKSVSVKVNTSGGTALQDAALQASGDDNEVVLNISANEETWVSISSHGKVIYSGIMQPSESRTLKGGEVATMKIGNAGGVDIQLNGKSIGKVGPRGQVRTVRFTRQDFHVISPEDQTPDADAPHDL